MCKSSDLTRIIFDLTQTVRQTLRMSPQILGGGTVEKIAEVRNRIMNLKMHVILYMSRWFAMVYLQVIHC